MSHLSREEAKEEMGDPRIYDFSCLKDPELAKKMLRCELCGKLAKDAVEWRCRCKPCGLRIKTQIILYCEGCIKSYLSLYGWCPFNKNKIIKDANRYIRRNRTARMQVLSLEVFCPHGNSYKGDQQFSLFVFSPPTLHSLLCPDVRVVNSSMGAVE